MQDDNNYTIYNECNMQKEAGNNSNDPLVELEKNKIVEITLFYEHFMDFI